MRSELSLLKIASETGANQKVLLTTNIRQCEPDPVMGMDKSAVLGPHLESTG